MTSIYLNAIAHYQQLNTLPCTLHMRRFDLYIAARELNSLFCGAYTSNIKIIYILQQLNVIITIWIYAHQLHNMKCDIIVFNIIRADKSDFK